MDFAEYIPDFRADFPAFDEERFDDAMVDMALGQTDIHFNSRWGAYEPYSIYRQGWFNLVAHSLLITETAMEDIEAGESASSTRGIDSVAVGDVSQVNGSQIMLKLEPWQDELASTVYGVAYLRLQRRVGAGFIAV